MIDIAITAKPLRQGRLPCATRQGGRLALRQHLSAEPLLKAADAVSTKIDALMSGADNVVPFKGAAG